MDKGIDWVHPGAWDVKARLQVMDECGIHAQVLFPNAVGLGGHRLNTVVQDEALRLLCVEIYNDAMAEMQEESSLRFLPMPVMPAWDVALCVKETERCAGLGLRGINMTSDPQDLGSPDLANRRGTRCGRSARTRMPVHFHIGSSNTAMDFFGNYFWPSQHEYVKPAIGGAMLFLNSARVVMNTVFARDLRPLPDLADGVGRERHRLDPVHPRDDGLRAASRTLRSSRAAVEAAVGVLPVELVRHVLVRGEPGRRAGLIDKVGEDRSFRDRLPAPDVSLPAPLETVAEKMNTLRPETRRKVMGDNAARLYRL